MSVFQMPYIPEKTHFVYAMLCQDEGGPLYVKFGRTTRLQARMTELRVGCPIPAQYFAFIQARSESQQIQIERELHNQFGARQSHGEWFKFDPSLLSDKEAFNDGSRTVFAGILGPGHYWDKVSVASLERHKKQKQRAFLSANKSVQRRIRNKQRFPVKQRKAWQDLDSYGKAG